MRKEKNCFKIKKYTMYKESKTNDTKTQLLIIYIHKMTNKFFIQKIKILSFHHNLTSK